MSYDPNDPDFQYLAIDKRKLVAEAPPFDSKKNCWVPDDKEGYAAAEIQSTKGDDVVVQISKTMEERTMKKDKVQQMNPPKFLKIEDMANMTYLNEASVLTNLRFRYESTLIYTYSGLFCVAINPYRRLPIYGMNVVDKFKGRKRNEVPPHLFNIADTAYSNMLQDRENQSMLITGESGAGKTENTKKVISYFALVAAGQSKKDEKKDDKKGSLEDQIVQANPVLEAYGNAKTTRNNNSSRFGKFIRIHFGTTGKIAGCDIETYLLEKSRVTYQQPGVERNYHVFYQLLSDKFPEYSEKLLVPADPGLFFFINQGCLTVDNMDDQEELQAMDDAFAVLGFAEDEKMALYKATCSILHLGEMKFKQRPREEQAEADGTAEAEKAAFLLGVNCGDLLKAMLKPKVKVGSEYVTKGQTKDQVNFGVNALSKSLYARMFNWLVARVNKTLETKTKRQFFIGVLDIAGFEIFEYNTFEQLCINYTNERLQQFFNHHMFVLEQEEYKKEGIVWEFIDFGMDLAACIELIEKPMGILSILEEECMFPKATDDSFLGKLNENHGGGKAKNFGKPKPSKSHRKGFEPHFELYHYAGTVGYNINGWLDKNKDPVNEFLVLTLAASKEPLVAMFFAPEEPAAAAKGGGGGGKKKGKGAAFKTISADHRESLGKLMDTLYSTHPHFVRCIIPNEVKTPGLIDSDLVLHQLQCNGVLEGIRICRKGFPNRMIYSEFKQRYTILAPNAVPRGFVDGKVATEKVLGACDLGDDYRCGHTKVFFKAGVLGKLEDIRDDRLSTSIGLFQSWMRSYIVRRSFRKLKEQRTALNIVQRNIRTWLTTRTWKWWELYVRLKPLMSAARGEDELKQMEEEFGTVGTKLEELEKLKKQLEEQNVVLLQEKNDMYLQLQSGGSTQADTEARLSQLQAQKKDFEAKVKTLEDKIDTYDKSGTAGDAEKKKMEEKIAALKTSIADQGAVLAKAQEEIKTKEGQVKTLNDEMARQDESIGKLNKDKKGLEEQNKKTAEDLAAEEDKANSLNKLKMKLEGTIDELEENLEREKKQHGDVDKVRRKLEGELKQTQELISDLERVKHELEETVKRKDGEIAEVNGKVEDEQNLIVQLQKKIKELQRKIEELEEELEAERQARVKVEKQRAEANRELGELHEKLDEAGGATQAQIDQHKKREAELAKMRRDLEEAQAASEQQIAAMKKKQQDACSELADQLDSLSKVKVKVEKERNQLKSEVDDANSQLDHISKSKASAEKLAKSLESQLNEANAKLDDCSRSINEIGNQKVRAQSENAELMAKLEDAESQVNALTKARQSIGKQLDDTKGAMEEESRIRAKLQGEARNLQADADTLREQLEEEQEARSNAQRALTKAAADAAEFRRKFESGEGGASTADFDDLKRKMGSKISELEGQVEAAQGKCSSLEKGRNRLQCELEDVMLEMERSTALASQTEKRQRAFDKTVDEWKRKVSDLQHELETSNSDSRNNANECFKLRAQIEESHDSIESLRRENKNLSDEIHDMTEQLGEGGRSVHELEKARKRLDMEKEELQSALEEAEAALEQEEAKVMRGTLEMAAIRQEIDRRLAEKDEEFDASRKNHQRALDSIQASLEAEARGKGEALRMKKKMESDINELEVALDGANRGRAEAEKNIKKYQAQIREVQSHVEEETRTRDEARDAFQQSERRANVLTSEIDELRTQLEAAERARKAAEGELHEAADRVNEMGTTAGLLTGQKRKLETDIQAMQTDLEEQASELKAAGETAKKAMSDAARLAEELRQEQEHAGHIEKMRRTMDGQVKELQVRLDEAEASSMKGGKRMIQKLEQRIRELEVELDNEQRLHTETTKGMRKQDRRLKELAFQADEDRKAQERLQDMIEKLNSKIKTYKHQVDEAEEIAAINLAKYRKVQHDLEEAEERADMSENTLVKLRTQTRGSSEVVTMGASSVKVKVTTTKVVSS